MEACDNSFNIAAVAPATSNLIHNFADDTANPTSKIPIQQEEFYNNLNHDIWRSALQGVSHDDGIQMHQLFTSGQKTLGLFNLPGRERLISHDYENIPNSSNNNNNFLKP